jgi:hypothetical protein
MATSTRKMAPPLAGGSVRPNPSLNHRTRYGKRRKPGLRHMVHHLSCSTALRATRDA